MKILITGVAGFMGSHLADYLLRHQKKIGFMKLFGIDNLSGGYLRNVPKDVNFIKLNLLSKTGVRKYIKTVQPDYVYHLAADATEGRSQFTPISAIENNINIFINLITPLIESKKFKKIVVTSSMSVYGSQTPPFDETMPRLPEDIYGIAKTAVEQSVEVLSKVHNFSYTIIRPHNVYGPKQNIADPYRNVIGIFINSLMRGKPFFIYGDGRQKRAFTYIDDFTPPFAQSMFLEKANGEIINLGPSKEYAVNEVADTILHVFYPKKPVPKNIRPRYIDSRPQEVILAYCTMIKAKKLLNFTPRTDLKEGIRQMISWAKSLGPQEFQYLKQLEINSPKAPITWKKRLY
ncbi:MAG: NAD-dependent epimerase/dehydratase family protein [bacterium]|nr:NAD-dependent epimerase/dehydratase family protein [bacterium]